MSALRRVSGALARFAAVASCLSLLHCAPPPLRAHAADDALGRHDRMIADILAYQKGEYGDSGGGYDTFRRDLLELHATPGDIKGLLVDDPKVNGAWKAYVDRGLATEADVTKAKTFAQTLATNMKEWRLHEEPGENDLQQAEYITIILAAAASSVQQQQAQQSAAQASGAARTSINGGRTTTSQNRGRSANGRTTATARSSTARSGSNGRSSRGSAGKSTDAVAGGGTCKAGTVGPGCCAGAGPARPDGASCVFDCNCSSNHCNAGLCGPGLDQKKACFAQCISTDQNCFYGTSTKCEPTPFTRRNRHLQVDRAIHAFETCAGDPQWHSSCLPKVMAVVPHDWRSEAASWINDVEKRQIALPAGNGGGMCPTPPGFELNSERVTQLQFWCSNERADCPDALARARNTLAAAQDVEECLWSAEFHVNRVDMQRKRHDECRTKCGWGDPAPPNDFSWPGSSLRPIQPPALPEVSAPAAPTSPPPPPRNPRGSSAEQ